MRQSKNLWYLIATNDRLELPLYYARNAEEVAKWLGVEKDTVYKSFIRRTRRNPDIAVCHGYQIERIWMGENGD